jgi:hypothetical protein
MHQTGQVQLRTSGILQAYAADRPAFEAFVHRGLGGAKRFQVFAMQRGLLFLELRDVPGTGSSGVSRAAVIGGLVGGAAGALVGHMIASSNAAPAQQELGFDMRSDEELLEIASVRKRSFVAKDEEIQSLSIDAPGGMARFFRGSNLAGWITLRDACLGKISMELRDQSAMSVAVDYLPRRFGERIRVNVELDPRARRFVPSRS